MEKNTSISSDLIRGHINTIILRELYEGDKYGLEIINDIETKTSGQYILKQPTLYSSLKRLETQGYIKSYWGGGETHGGRRRYYALTDSGRNITEQNQAEWEYSRTVIDKLISEKEFDFDSPPPVSNIDFNILKQTTTRVSTGGSKTSDDLEERENYERELEAKKKLLFDEEARLIALNVERERVIQDIESYKKLAASQEEKPIAPALESKAEKAPVSFSQSSEQQNIVFSEERETKGERDYKLLLNKLVNKKRPEMREAASPVSEKRQEPETAPVNKAEAPETFAYERNAIDDFNTFSLETQSKNFQKEIIDDYNLLPKRQQGKIDFSDLYDGTDDGIKVRSYSKDSKAKASKKTGGSGLLLKNKLNLNVSLVLFFCMLAEIILCYALFNSILDWKFSVYIWFAGIALVVPAVFFVLYVLSPNKRTLPKFNFKDSLQIALLIFLQLILVIFGCALIFDVSLLKAHDLIGYIIVPITGAVNIPLSVIIYRILYKSDKFIVK